VNLANTCREKGDRMRERDALEARGVLIKKGVTKKDHGFPRISLKKAQNKKALRGKKALLSGGLPG